MQGRVQPSSRFQNGESGAIIVEVAIYFPIVLAIVFSIIYYGMWMVQKSVIDFDAAKVADSAAKALSYEGWEYLYDNDMLDTDTSVDFHWRDGQGQPDASDVQEYYKAKKSLYLGHNINTQSYITALQELVNHTKVFPAQITECNVEVKNKLVTKTVCVTVKFGFQTPGIMRYLGVKEKTIGMKSIGYEYTVNPTDFIRTADLAFDLGEFILDKMGFDVQSFLAKWANVKKALGL